MDIFTKSGLSRDFFDLVAKSTSFIQRVRKLSGADYFYILIFNAANDIMSYNSMASTFINDSNKSVNKQALHKAFAKDNFELFFDTIFEAIFSIKTFIGNSERRKEFKRILIQDSTILKIPKALYDAFSGVSFGLGKSANCRIQLAVDILSNVFTYFSIDTYSQNDVSQASKLKIKKGDLILRDRGYFKAEEIYRIIKSGAHFISRFFNGVLYYDEKGLQIDILKELKKKKLTRMMVRIGGPTNPIVVLFAVKINEDIANERRRKGKITASTNSVSKNTLALYSWQIYLTSIQDESYSIEEIYNFYSLRWRIEIIFKALKSNVNFGEIHEVPERQLRFILKSRILLLILITQFIYHPIQSQIEKRNLNFQISLIQLVTFIIRNIKSLFSMFENVKKITIDLNDPVVVSICKYCRYSKKNKIDNYENRLSQCLSGR